MRAVMPNTQKTIDATVSKLQAILDRDYPHLEWRVLVRQEPPETPGGAPWLYVHARTRDFRTRSRVGRPWAIVSTSPALRLLVAELAAEAEAALAQVSPG